MMKNNNKMETLLRLLEHPYYFSEKEKDDILSDSECRELYNRLVEVRNALALKQADGELPDADEAWKAFRSNRARHRTGVRRMAVAAFAALLLAAGVTAAMFHSFSSGTHNAMPAASAMAKVSPLIPSLFGDSTTTDTLPAARPYKYDNVTLEQILDDVAAVYHVGVRYTRPALRNIRLYMQWHSGQELHEVLALINHFENMQLLLEGDTIIVK